MDSRLSTPYKDILFREPDTLMDRDLLKIPLSTLSKCLDPVFAPFSTFIIDNWGLTFTETLFPLCSVCISAVAWDSPPGRNETYSTLGQYLSPCKVLFKFQSSYITQVPKIDNLNTYHNQWCQALRNRGLSENALVHEVEKWKEGKVFQSMSRRYPPSPFDIAKAYVNTPENTPRKWLSKDEMCLKSKESDFSGPPPPGYVCNRCGKNGMPTFYPSSLLQFSGFSSTSHSFTSPKFI